MSSFKERQSAIKKLKNLNLTSKIDVYTFRDRLEKAFSTVFLPNNVEFTEKQYGHVKCDVLIPEIYATNRILLYIHGGSFVGGSRKTVRAFASSLANATASRTVVPEFRLAPAHPFPAPLEDIQTVFQNVYTELSVSLSLSDTSSSEKQPEILIAADTSGATLAMALAFTLKAMFKKVVRQIILFSPWLDLSESSEKFSIKKNGDEVFTADSIRLCCEHFTFQENWEKPLISPLKAPRELLLDLPPVYIQMGDKELFYDDAIVFHSMLKNSGCDCVLDIWKGMMPMFQLADEYLEESHLAIEKIGKMITNQDHSNESVYDIALKLEKSERAEKLTYDYDETIDKD